MKKVLTIAGSDCSGGAGIQADLKTFDAHCVYGMSVVTAVVAENTSRVIDVFDVTVKNIADQIDAIYEDIEVNAVKIGMLSCPETMQMIAQKIQQYNITNVVIDPVMYAKNGCALMQEHAINALIEYIIPCATVLTPNVPEAEKITGMSIKDTDDMKRAAEKIYAMKCRFVLVKGGHINGEATDILFDGSNFHEYSAQRIETKNTHGTGCTYSSAIAANIAIGHSIPQAVANAKNYITTAIKNNLPIGKGHGPVGHLWELYQKAGLV